MTANRKYKRRVRARMAKTGECYTAALRHLRRAKEANMSTYELRHGGVTDVGHVRASNQDELLVEGELVAVADGMGEHQRGEVASRLAIQTLKDAFGADPSADGLVSAVQEANRVVVERAQTAAELQGMGTTIAAAALVGDEGRTALVVVNVGDSRVYLFREGDLARLSSDHSLVAQLVRAGELTEEAARTHPQRHILTHVLGLSADVEPFVTQTVPASGDRLLLCSDGLFNEVGEDEITGVLASVSDPEEAANRLVALANEHGGSDNITAVVFDMS
jgi:protein phosphatase